MQLSKLIRLLPLLVIVSGCALALAQPNAEKLPPKLPANDPFYSIVNNSYSSIGEIVYLVNTLPPGPPRPITYTLVVRQISQGSSPSRLVSTAEITADYVNLLFGCSFSPNGQYVLIKQGRPQGEFGSYRILFWNLKTRKVEPGPDLKINYQYIAWSPTSASVAYIQGGSANGWEGQGAKPVSLHVWNLQTRKDKLIAQNPDTKNFAWTKQGSLLFSCKNKDSGNIPEDLALKHPGVYESSTTRNTTLEVIQDAYNPVPSLDGRFIAFLGWPTVKKRLLPSKNNGQYMDSDSSNGTIGLYLFERKTGLRHLIQVFGTKEAPNAIMWSRDSKFIYDIQNIYSTKQPSYIESGDPTVYSGQGQGLIHSVDIVTLRQTVIATIPATDAMARPDPESQFAFKGGYVSGKYLYVLVHELHDDDPSASYLTTSRTLYSIDLHSHAACPLWIIKGAEGADWKESAY